MLTNIRIMGADNITQLKTVDIPEDPGLDKLNELIKPHLGPDYYEHVSVLYEGQPCDMFVDENGKAKGLPRNEEATKIYRTYWLKEHPGTDPESLDIIVGTAVLFTRRVWF